MVVYVPRLGNQRRLTARHFSRVTGRNWRL